MLNQESRISLIGLENMKMQQNKICVVGGGNWEKNHIRTLSQMGFLSGVVESDSDVLNKLKMEYNNIHFFNNIDSAIKFGFDGFVVATPAKTHFEISKKIIESKHHILIEKPITDNVKDAVALVELANLNGINLMVGHLLLFHPAFY